MFRIPFLSFSSKIQEYIREVYVIRNITSGKAAKKFPAQFSNPKNHYRIPKKSATGFYPEPREASPGPQTSYGFKIHFKE
jgi:hypothetical protein